LSQLLLRFPISYLDARRFATIPSDRLRRELEGRRSDEHSLKELAPLGVRPLREVLPVEVEQIEGDVRHGCRLHQALDLGRAPHMHAALERLE
jgi:hypothetical protein